VADDLAVEPCRFELCRERALSVPTQISCPEGGEFARRAGKSEGEVLCLEVSGGGEAELDFGARDDARPSGGDEILTPERQERKRGEGELFDNGCGLVVCVRRGEASCGGEAAAKRTWRTVRPPVGAVLPPVPRMNV